MFKIKKILPLIILLSVTSCGNNLRQDIADFIKPFSYQTARNSVKYGHYIDKNEGKNNGVSFLQINEVSFDVREDGIVSFLHHYESSNYPGSVDESFDEKITTVDGKYIYDNRGVISELTYNEAFNKTDLFFYLNYYPDTGHHDGGMYYGDIIKAEAYKQQQFITINESKTELRYYVKNVKTENATITMDFAVNTLGMYVYVDDSGASDTNPNTYFHETITVEY